MEEITVREGIIDKLDSLSDEEQMFIFDILLGISNGKVIGVSYEVLGEGMDNVITKRTLVID